VGPKNRFAYPVSVRAAGTTHGFRRLGFGTFAATVALVPGANLPLVFGLFGLGTLLRTTLQSFSGLLQLRKQLLATSDLLRQRLPVGLLLLIRLLRLIQQQLNILT